MQHRGVLTPQSQLVYVVQWLGEFSEIEKDDFLHELLDLYAPGQLPIGQVLERVKFEDRPPTLFQCRMDLLKEWYASWNPEAEREELLSRISEADSEFFERFDKSRSLPNEEKVVEEFWIRNGSCNGKVNGIENGQTTPESENRSPIEDENPLEQQNTTVNRDEPRPLNSGASSSDRGHGVQLDVEEGSNSSDQVAEGANEKLDAAQTSVQVDADESHVEKPSLPPMDTRELEQSERNEQQNEQAEEGTSTTESDPTDDRCNAVSASDKAAAETGDAVTAGGEEHGPEMLIELADLKIQPN